MRMRRPLVAIAAFVFVWILAFWQGAGHSVSFQNGPGARLPGAPSSSRDIKDGFIPGTTHASPVTNDTFANFGERIRSSVTLNKNEIFSFQYERDALGLISKITEVIEAQTNTYTYTYDLAGRLTDVARNETNVSHYDFDSNGNRLAYKSRNGTLQGSYDEQDRLKQYDETFYGHTAKGQWASKTFRGKKTSYNYDTFGNLRAVILPDGVKVEYLIDDQNRRVGKKVNGSLVQGFLYQGRLRPTAELDNHNNVVSRFLYANSGNVPDYIEKADKTYRIIKDHLGSPRLVVDVVTGKVSQRIDYDEFGNVLQDTNPGFQPFGFAGGLYDQHTKLTRFGARDYDAFSGRWTTKDPIGFAAGDLNLYAYVRNDPINSRDPTGLYKEDTHWGRSYKWGSEILCFSGALGGWECRDIAKQIADGNQGMDDAPCGITVAEGVPCIPFPWSNPQNPFNTDTGTFWHFMDRNELEAHLAVAVELCDYALFGEWLHSYQDTWAHGGYLWDPENGRLGHVVDLSREGFREGFPFVNVIPGDANDLYIEGSARDQQMRKKTEQWLERLRSNCFCPPTADNPPGRYRTGAGDKCVQDDESAPCAPSPVGTIGQCR